MWPFARSSMWVSMNGPTKSWQKKQRVGLTVAAPVTRNSVMGGRVLSGEDEIALVGFFVALADPAGEPVRQAQFLLVFLYLLDRSRHPGHDRVAQRVAGAVVFLLDVVGPRLDLQRGQLLDQIRAGVEDPQPRHPVVEPLGQHLLDPVPAPEP